jgi:hypothetical protein
MFKVSKTYGVLVVVLGAGGLGGLGHSSGSHLRAEARGGSCQAKGVHCGEVKVTIRNE